MLTKNEAIRAAAALIAADDGDHNLGTLIWDTHLTDPDTKARDLTFITVAALSIARGALDATNLDATQILDALTTRTLFDDLTANFHDDGGADGAD